MAFFSSFFNFSNRNSAISVTAFFIPVNYNTNIYRKQMHSCLYTCRRSIGHFLRVSQAFFLKYSNFILQIPYFPLGYTISSILTFPSPYTSFPPPLFRRIPRRSSPFALLRGSQIRPYSLLRCIFLHIFPSLRRPPTSMS